MNNENPKETWFSEKEIKGTQPGIPEKKPEEKPEPAPKPLPQKPSPDIPKPKEVPREGPGVEPKPFPKRREAVPEKSIV